MPDQLQTDLGTVFNDDSFKKANQSEQVKFLSGLFDKHGYANSPSEEKSKLANALLTKHFGTGATASSPELSRGVPPALRTAEEIGGVGVGMLGAAGGAALAGPAAPLGGAMGWAGAKTAADAASAELNKKLYGTPTDFSRENIGADIKANMIGGAIGEFAGPVVGKGLAAMSPARAAESRLGEVATEAAAKAEAKSGLERPPFDVPGKTRDAAVGEQMDEQIKQGQEDFSLARQAARDKADADMAAAREKLIGKAGPEAQQETIASSLGRTPEQTRAAQFADPTGYAQRQTEIRQSIFDVKNKADEEFNQRYEDTFAKHNDKPITLTATAKKAAEMKLWAEQNNIALSPSIRKLLDESQDLSAPKSDVSIQSLGIKPKEWKRLAPAEQQMILANAKKLKTSVMTSQGVPYVSPAEIAAKKSGTTVAQARGLNSKFGEAMGGQGTDGYVARQMRESVLEDLGNANVPGAKQLNAEYRQFRHGGLGDYDFTSKVSTPKAAGSGVNDITNIAPQIFDNPQRGMDFAKRLSPEQKAQFREVYADYINKGGKSDVGHAPILKELGMPGPLSKPESFVYLDKQFDNLSEVFANAPNAKAKFQASIRSEIEKVENRDAQASLRDAYQSTQKLGVLGKGIQTRINAAKTLREKADIAAESITGAKVDDYMRALNGAKDKAAVDAIQKYQYLPGSWSSYFKRRAAFMAMMGMGGRGSIGGVATAGAIGSATGIRDLLAKSFAKTIAQDPAAALRIYRAALQPGAPASLSTLSQGIVNGVISEGGSQAIKSKTGTTLEKKPAPAAKGTPMADAVDITHARTIAGAGAAPEKVDTILDTNEKIAAGKAPDVGDSLRSGRLSTTDLRKMVDNKPATIAAMFDGMSVQDALHAFSQGSEEEKNLALPAIAQKLQDEGKKLPPEQQTAMMNTLRKAMQPEAATGEVG